MTTKKKKTLKFTYLYEGDPDERTDTYVGEVKDGVMHGKGEYTFHHGVKYVGIFRNGKFLCKLDAGIYKWFRQST